MLFCFLTDALIIINSQGQWLFFGMRWASKKKHNLHLLVVVKSCKKRDILQLLGLVKAHQLYSEIQPGQSMMSPFFLLLTVILNRWSTPIAEQKRLVIAMIENIK